MTMPLMNGTPLPAWPLGAYALELSRVGAAVFAMALGLLLLFVVGFAHPEAIHEATHDARHAAGFPCH